MTCYSHSASIQMIYSKKRRTARKFSPEVLEEIDHVLYRFKSAKINVYLHVIFILLYKVNENSA